LNLPFDKGIRYIPVPPMSKAPVAKGWNLRENAITDQSDAWRLEEKNVALALTYCDPPVIHGDFDNYPLALKELAKHNIDLKKVLTEANCVFHSGRKNSISALWHLPEDAPKLITKVLRVDKQVAIEFRCATAGGRTCASVIPESTHPSGSKYQFLDGHSLNTIEEIPKKLLAFASSLTSTRTPKKKATQRDYKTNFGYETPRRLALLRDQLSFIDPDCDYHTWRDIIWATLSTGFPSAYSIARDWSEGAPHRYNYAHFLNTADNFKPGHFTAGTVFHYARIGGWNG
jgi:putative DNA primase/helicase